MPISQCFCFILERGPGQPSLKMEAGWNHRRSCRLMSRHLIGEGAVRMKSGNDLRILVVEDEIFISMLLEDMLMDLGCSKIDIAASVDKALELLAAAMPDFAILDINLNGQKSFPVADLLHRRDVPFVYISGYGEGGLEGGRPGARILQKPFRVNDLRSVIDDALTDQKEALSSH